MATMGVGRVPGRKRPALWIEEGNQIRVLAFFSSAKTMHEFLAMSPRYKHGGIGSREAPMPFIGPLTRTEHARRARELHNGS